MDTHPLGIVSASASVQQTPTGGREQLAVEMAQIVTTAINSDRADAGVADIVALLVGGGLADWGGITTLLPDTGAFYTTAHTSEMVRIVDALQYRSNEGPCVHASIRREVISFSC